MLHALLTNCSLHAIPYRLTSTACCIALLLANNRTPLLVILTPAALAGCHHRRKHNTLHFKKSSSSISSYNHNFLFSIIITSPSGPPFYLSASRKVPSWINGIGKIGRIKWFAQFNWLLLLFKSFWQFTTKSHQINFNFSRFVDFLGHLLEKMIGIRLAKTDLNHNTNHETKDYIL